MAHIPHFWAYFAVGIGVLVAIAMSFSAVRRRRGPDA
jgi:hypothetical protein